jgi:hypothetical protein
MIKVETGFPFARTGLNGLKGPAFSARNNLPSATKAAILSSSVCAELEWGFFITATARFRFITSTA